MPLVWQKSTIGYPESLVFSVNEVVAVVEEHLSLYAPVVVKEVWVVEVHAPPFPLRRKTAEEQHPCVLGQERAQGGDTPLRQCSVLCSLCLGMPLS